MVCIEVTAFLSNVLALSGWNGSTKLYQCARPNRRIPSNYQNTKQAYKINKKTTKMQQSTEHTIEKINAKKN